MGATGASDNRKRNKLKLVKNNGDVEIMETRQVNDLGFSSPESTEYIQSCLAEIEAVNDNNFNFCRKKVKPRVLLGLKSGKLLSQKLEHHNLRSLNLGKPIFSPNLVAWKTPLTKQLLVTGKIGINKDLIDDSRLSSILLNSQK